MCLVDAVVGRPDHVEHEHGAGEGRGLGPFQVGRYYLCCSCCCCCWRGGLVVVVRGGGVGALAALAAAAAGRFKPPSVARRHSTNTHRAQARGGTLLSSLGGGVRVELRVSTDGLA